MADEDKLLGVRISGNTTTRVYGRYRIDYDSTDSITDIADKADEDYDGALKNPPSGYSGHEAKDGYQRKVIAENSSVKDEVEGDLTEAGISFTTEDVSPTQDEQDALDQFGATNSLEGLEAMTWKRAVDDLENGNITQAEFERGNNTNTGESFGRPKNVGRGPN